jgi:hypothetical protein
MAGLAIPTFTPGQVSISLSRGGMKIVKKRYRKEKKAINKLKKNESPGNLTTYEMAGPIVKLSYLNQKRKTSQNFVRLCLIKNVVQKYFGKKIRRI